MSFQNPDFFDLWYPCNHSKDACEQTNQLNPQDSQTDLHESINSVSSAIKEFCKADDVPLPPPDEKMRQMRTRTKDQHQKSRVAWMESSFVAAKKDSPPNEKIQIQITPSATNGSLCNEVT